MSSSAHVYTLYCTFHSSLWNRDICMGILGSDTQKLRYSEFYVSPSCRRLRASTLVGFVQTNPSNSAPLASAGLTKRGALCHNQSRGPFQIRGAHSSGTIWQKLSLFLLRKIQ